MNVIWFTHVLSPFQLSSLTVYVYLPASVITCSCLMSYSCIQLSPIRPVYMYFHVSPCSLSDHRVPMDLTLLSFTLLVFLHVPHSMIPGSPHVSELHWFRLITDLLSAWYLNCTSDLISLSLLIMLIWTVYCSLDCLICLISSYFPERTTSDCPRPVLSACSPNGFGYLNMIMKTVKTKL